MLWQRERQVSAWLPSLHKSEAGDGNLVLETCEREILKTRSYFRGMTEAVSFQKLPAIRQITPARL